MCFIILHYVARMAKQSSQGLSHKVKLSTVFSLRIPIKEDVLFPCPCKLFPQLVTEDLTSYIHLISNRF